MKQQQQQQSNNNRPSHDKNHKTKIKSTTLTCIQTLRPPPNHCSKVISKTDALLDSYYSSSSSSTTPATHVTSPVWHCSWSLDGTLLATCHGRPDPCIRLWKCTPSSSSPSSPSSWKLIATLRDESPDGDTNKTRTIRSVAFAPTPPNVRAILAAASFDGCVSIWEDFSSESHGKREEVPSHHLNSVVIAAAAAADYNDNDDYNSNSTTIHDTACGWECTAQLEGHESEVKDVTWNATGTLLASCGRDKTVWIWECFLPGTIGGDGNGSTGPTGGEGDFECLAVLQGHGGDVKSVAFAPSHGQFGDGDEILLSASYDDSIRCWAEDAGDWYCALSLEGVHMSTIWSIAISPSGVRMVSGSADQSLAIWKCYTASEKREMEQQQQQLLLQRPETASSSSGGENKSDKNGMHSDGLWKCVGKLPHAHSECIYSVDCAPSRAGHGRIVSGGGDDCIQVYREVGGTSDAPLFTVDGSVKKAHDGDVNCVKWHPTDGRLMASVGDDGLVKIWRYE